MKNNILNLLTRSMTFLRLELMHTIFLPTKRMLKAIEDYENKILKVYDNVSVKKRYHCKGFS